MEGWLDRESRDRAALRGCCSRASPIRSGRPQRRSSTLLTAHKFPGASVRERRALGSWDDWLARHPDDPRAPEIAERAQYYREKLASERYERLGARRPPTGPATRGARILAARAETRPDTEAVRRCENADARLAALEPRAQHTGGARARRPGRPEQRAQALRRARARDGDRAVRRGGGARAGVRGAGGARPPSRPANTLRPPGRASSRSRAAIRTSFADALRAGPRALGLARHRRASGRRDARRPQRPTPDALQVRAVRRPDGRVRQWIALGPLRARPRSSAICRARSSTCSICPASPSR